MTTVSAVIPVRNCERYLGEAIDSVLAQTLPPAELIVVDDGSTDGSAAVAESYGDQVACIRRAAEGTGTAVDAGVAASGGALIAFLDADDLWSPDKLETQVAITEARPEIDAIFGHADQFLSPDLADGERERLRPDLPEGPAKVRGTMVVRRAAAEGTRFATKGLAVGEFIDWYLRAQEAGLRDAMADRVVLHRRIHESNLSRADDANRSDLAKVLAEARRRRKG